MPTIQVRWGDTTAKLTLYWPDRNSRWHVYILIRPGRTDKVLEEKSNGIRPTSSSRAESLDSALFGPPTIRGIQVLEGRPRMASEPQLLSVKIAT